MEQILFDSSKDKEPVKVIPVPTEITLNNKDLPTPEDMARLAACHSKELWGKFCASPAFIDALCTDIKKASVLAEKIRDGKNVDNKIAPKTKK